MAAKPRYQDIADAVREAILGEHELLGSRLVAGAQMPTEPEISQYFQVARGTVRQALDRLAAEGLIERRGRRGTFVRRLPVLTYSAQSEDPNRVGDGDTWTSIVEKAGHHPTADFSFRIVPASMAVAKRLQVERDDLVVVRELDRRVDDTPWLNQVSYYPMDVARECGLDTPHDIAEGTVRRMAAHGYREIRMVHEISSRPSTVEEVNSFGLATGVPVLVYWRTAWTTERPVRATCEVLPADRNAVTWMSERSS